MKRAAFIDSDRFVVWKTDKRKQALPSFMVKSKPKTIEEVLRKFEPEQTTIAQKLRTLVKTTLPDASETVRRGIITYILNNKDFARIHLVQGPRGLGFARGREA